jgi:hypothetical protein
MLVRAYPLAIDVDALKQFGEHLLGERRAELDAFYRKYGVRHESWHSQVIAGTTWIICCDDIREPTGAAAEYGAASNEFDVWFKQEVLRLTGVNPNMTPFGPPSETVFSWDDPGEEQAGEQKASEQKAGEVL